MRSYETSMAHERVFIDLSVSSRNNHFYLAIRKLHSNIVNYEYEIPSILLHCYYKRIHAGILPTRITTQTRRYFLN